MFKACSTTHWHLLYSEVLKLINLKLYVTFPITTASAERSSSVLRQVKTYLRSGMMQEKLNKVILLLHCHNKIYFKNTTFQPASPTFSYLVMNSVSNFSPIVSCQPHLHLEHCDFDSGVDLKSFCKLYSFFIGSCLKWRILSLEFLLFVICIIIFIQKL